MEPFYRRLFVLALGFIAILAVFLYRLISLQLIEGDKYRRFSQANTFREIPLSAPRGKILDRRGEVLADNRADFQLTLNVGQVKDLDRSIQTLGFLLDEDEAVVRERIAGGKTLPSLRPQTVARGLDHDGIAKIRAKMTKIKAGGAGELDLNGIELGVGFERIYPFQEKIGHVLGYVREASEKELKEGAELAPGRVEPGDSIGIAGVEKALDLRLRGFDGFRQTVVDARGREIDLSDLELEDLLRNRPVIGGENLQLTLDARLMAAAYEAFGNRVGALAALDPRNGEILALLSKPSYNPEDLSGKIPTALWNRLRDDPNKILLNRPLQAAYPPGSTHKIVTALAALAYGKTDFKETLHCPGYYQLGNRRWGCWNKRGHGRVNLHQALVRSCDVFFYQLGERLGPDPIAHFANLLGLGKKTEVLKDFERQGLIPTEAWKLKNKKENWHPSDNLGTSIGQGYNLVTPLQNALMLAQFSNGGKKIKPHLLKASIAPDGQVIPEPLAEAEALPLQLSPEQVGELKRALIDVVNSPGGTGANAKLQDVKVGGKTGTAQVIGHDSRAKVGRGVKIGDHAWFVAFAPAEQPEIAVAVLVEHGGGGGAIAAPIAKRVLEEYFRNRKIDAGAIAENENRQRDEMQAAVDFESPWCASSEFECH